MKRIKSGLIISIIITDEVYNTVDNYKHWLIIYNIKRILQRETTSSIRQIKTRFNYEQYT